ncbi:YdjY domain-containing protein [Persicirhabdus sediminis]|uniref:DUF4424 domain-containing protein n=1 Tax=Persicirhabdus sediminis TaxID=454144 RepID=A0A8J7MFQ1_9BACT|nr:YdjY domain-containing protein [Persicirhabdus sediminis]MBK1790954.1 hypothetical protein [Persicirhabdus sediminis]
MIRLNATTFLLIAASLTSQLFAQTPADANPSPAEPATAAADAKPEIEQISENEYRIGKVVINKKTRQLKLPAAVHMDKDIIEYVLITNLGKAHEALLITDIKPSNLNIGFKLLSYPESNDLFRQPNPDGSLGTEYYQVDEKIKQQARIQLAIEWADAEGKTQSAPLSSWIANTATKQRMPETPWVYNGSEVFQGNFSADIYGDILSIQPDVNCIANYTGDDRETAEWEPHSKVPKPGTEVTVIISPLKLTK